MPVFQSLPVRDWDSRMKRGTVLEFLNEWAEVHKLSNGVQLTDIISTIFSESSLTVDLIINSFVQSDS
jgi:hypothetical protein